MHTTVPPTPLGPRDLTGSTVGTSGSLVHAEVRLAPVPQITPAALKPFLTPVRDDTGAVIDYRLDHEALFASDSDEARRATSVFREWRATWLVDVTIGPLDLVRAFQQTAHALAAAAGGSLPVLRRLDVQDDIVDAATAVVLADEMEQARQWLLADPRRGFGLLDADRRVFVRTMAPVDGDDVLLAAAGVRVLSTPDGLALDTAGAPRATDAGVSRHQLTGWTVTGERGLVAHTDDGDLPVVGTVAERLLAWLAPGVADVVVRPVPLTTVWARTLTGLPEALDAASRAGRSVRLLAVED